MNFEEEADKIVKLIFGGMPDFAEPSINEYIATKLRVAYETGGRDTLKAAIENMQ